jgi:DNA invertase Pin-like site-specific DNA recombinase
VCLDYVREGDTLVITRLDRLARSTLHLCQMAAELERKQVNLQVLNQNIDTGDATGCLLSAPQIAELRQRRKQGNLIKTLMKDYGLSKASVYRYLGSTQRTQSLANTGSFP